MTDTDTLPGLEKPAQTTGYFGEGPTEKETRLAISEIDNENPIKGSRRTVKQLCLSLAKSIDAGNAKGRAIANEAAQLFAMMQQLDPPAAAGTVPDPAALSPDLQRLFDALSAAPQFDAAPEGDSPEL